MSKFAQGFYPVKNAHKYIGKGTPKFRSSWECTLMKFLDEHPGIHKWSSESIAIPYKCPFTGKKRNYIPDFFVISEDKSGNKKAEILEVKPFKQTGIKSTKSVKDQAAAVLNAAKWKACGEYCSKNGLGFRILTEQDLFRNGKK